MNPDSNAQRGPQGGIRIPATLSGWTLRTLNDCISTLIDYRGKTPTKTSFGIPLVTAKVVKNGRINTPVEFIAAEDYSTWMRRGVPKPRDVVITTEAPLGEVAQLGPDRVALAQRLIVLRGRDDLLDNDFLKFLLQSEVAQNQLRARASGTTVLGIKQSELRKIELLLPPIAEQHAIAHILGTLDDKIELNRRMSETLEEMARALFRSWFVDLDPVRLGATSRDRCSPPFPADLIPVRFVESDLGMIPEGWLLTPLRNLVSCLSRGIGPVYVDRGGICVLNQKCIRGRRVNFHHARRHDLNSRQIEDRMLRPLDILVNSTGVGTLGRTAQVWDLPERAIVDSHVTAIRAASGVDPWFLGMALTGRESEIEALGEGTTGQTELSRERLGALMILTPPSVLQAAYGRSVGALLLQVAAHDRTSATLAALRDALVPKLISGELRIKDAERFVQDATA